MLSIDALESLDSAPYPKRETPWGKEFLILGGDGATETVKIIWVNPGARLSEQSHQKRLEQWAILSHHGGIVSVETPSGALLDTTAQQGGFHRVPKGARHRLTAPLMHPLVVLEVAFGEFDQNDIKRFKDDYGRAE